MLRSLVGSEMCIRDRYSYDLEKYKGEIFLMYSYFSEQSFVEISNVHEKNYILTISYLAETLINEIYTYHVVSSIKYLPHYDFHNFLVY